MFTMWLRLMMAALLLTAGVGQAQMSRSFFPWWEMGFTRDLNLSEQQQQQIREILRENRSKMIDMRAALEKAEGEVEDLFEESNADQRKANETVERVVAARASMTRHFTLMSLQMRKSDPRTMEGFAISPGAIRWDAAGRRSGGAGGPGVWRRGGSRPAADRAPCGAAWATEGRQPPQNPPQKSAQ
jgi:Spy/CpxP family protein refolding chaperone